NWSKAYINNRAALPLCKLSKKYSCVEDEDLAADLKLHLQSIRKFTHAQDLVDYLSIPANQATHGFKKTISLKTAQRWMMKLGYRWKKEPTGQYSDGHERDDVVYYRQNVFLPAWNEGQSQMRQWDRDALSDPSVLEGDEEIGQRLVVWFHDESTFYANDHRKQRWVHMSEGAVPQPKGEGASLMVADFVSADYGWLRSPDGKESARILFRAGKARDGYFTNENIVAHAEKAMDILQKYYPHEDHALIFDNATTHLKWADDALSARKLPKSPSKSWGITVTKKDSSGKAVLGADGKPLKEKIQMADGELPNGDLQPLYFSKGHVKAGWFKGMAQILIERGYVDALQLRAECKDFKCPSPAGEVDCCCRRLLYSQPDFASVKSVLESSCQARGIKVIFLPKFHCELNFIEQCWGYAKRIYRMLGPSESESVLEQNVINSLDAVPLSSMRRFAVRSARFIDAYQKGLNGVQAAWAIKKYRGHCVLPPSIMQEFDDVHPVPATL
ncbi:hypothetical protein BDR04DRAFT_1022347, partial [Suillus decipiens]